MRATSVVICGLAALLLVACDGEPSAAVTPADQTAEALTARQQRVCQRRARLGRPTPYECGGREDAPPAGFEEACDERQWVGYRIAVAECPSAPSVHGTWTITEPFALSRDPELQRLCVYTWLPADPAQPTPDVDALPDTASLRLERDCDVVGGHAVPDEVNDALFEAFAAQIELPDWSIAAPFALAPTRVAVIDGGFGGAQWDVPLDTVDHPEAVSSVVRAATCPDRGAGPVCAATVPNYNAMAYVQRGIEGALGGYFGTQIEYAAAVAEAVDEWRLAPDRARPAHLILNLSLGWDARYGLEEAERLPALAAFWATRYAACEGALLIAAAGNKAADGDTGPLAPAAWEALRRECPGDERLPRGTYAPLVHAVGGVDGRDAPLAVVREDATPRLVAPGQAVVVPLDTQTPVDAPTKVLSGTSMSTAAVAGAAALVWSLRPELTGDEVMALIYAASEPLGPKADFGLKPLRRQRRLSVARAFALACPDGAPIGNCPPAASRPTLPPPRPAGGDATPDFDALDPLLFADAVPVAVDELAPDPQGSSAYLDPFVVPQPGSPNCPVCGFYTCTLKGQLDPNLKGANLGTPVVKVKTFNGQFLDIKLAPLPDSSSFSVGLCGPLGNQPPIWGFLQIPVTAAGKTTLTSSELFVY